MIKYLRKNNCPNTETLLGPPSEIHKKTKQFHEATSEKRRTMNLLDLTEDHIWHIVYELDIASFIFFISTCKYLFAMRHTSKWYVNDIYKFYWEYDPRPYIPMLLNSYIDIERMQSKERRIIKNLPKKIDYKMLKNTMNILPHYQLCNPSTFVHIAYDESILETCCKAICRYYKYSYKRPHESLYRIFWQDWQYLCVNVIELCEIAYHIRHRKYHTLYNMMHNLEFRLVYSCCIFDTISFLIKFVEYETNKQIKAVVVCLLYMYMMNDIDGLMQSSNYNKNFQDTVIEKGYEFIECIEEMHKFPKYLRNFLNSTIQECVDLMSQIQ